MGLLLWVEPERAFEGTQMAREHPEWLLGPVPSGNTNGMNYMVNLGNAAARQHITELISSLIAASGATCYRQDFNDLRVPELFRETMRPIVWVSRKYSTSQVYIVSGMRCWRATGAGDRQLRRRRAAHRPGGERPQCLALAQRPAVLAF